MAVVLGQGGAEISERFSCLMPAGAPVKTPRLRRHDEHGFVQQVFRPEMIDLPHRARPVGGNDQHRLGVFHQLLNGLLPVRVAGFDPAGPQMLARFTQGHQRPQLAHRPGQIAFLLRGPQPLQPQIVGEHEPGRFEFPGGFEGPEIDQVGRICRGLTLDQILHDPACFPVRGRLEHLANAAAQPHGQGD